MDPRLNPAPRSGKRNIYCPYYSDCLNTAIREGWSHWNCARCGQRTNREAEPELRLNVNHTIAYYEMGTKPN